MTNEVSIRCQKHQRLVYGVYPRIRRIPTTEDRPLIHPCAWNAADRNTRPGTTLANNRYRRPFSLTYWADADHDMCGAAHGSASSCSAHNLWVWAEIGYRYDLINTPRDAMWAAFPTDHRIQYTSVLCGRHSFFTRDSML